MFGGRLPLQAALYLPQLDDSILVVRQGRVFDHRVDPTFLLVVIIAVKKYDLFAQEQFLLKPRLRAVIIRKRLALFELPFERLDDFTDDAPIVVARNAVDD